MKVFLYELKKIFSWKLILLVILLNVLLFKLLIEFDLKHFPNGRPSGDMFQIEQQLIPLYGTKIDEREFKDLTKKYEQIVQEANQYLANDPEAKKAGLENYEKFRNYDRMNELQSDYHDKIVFERNLDFAWQLQAYESYLDNYKYAKESMLAKKQEAETTAQKNHFERLLEEEKFPVYSEIVMQNFKTYATSVAIAIFLSVLIFISPIFLRDKQTNVLPLQYTSKKGRKTFRIKWGAGLFSTFVVTTCLLTFYMMLYKTNDTSSHFDLPLHTLDWYDHWYDITFYEYILLTVIVIAVMAILLGIITMAISNSVANTIVLIAIQIIVAFIMVAGGASVIVRNVIDLQFAQAFVPIVLIVFFMMTILTTYFIWKSEKSKDIV